MLGESARGAGDLHVCESPVPAKSQRRHSQDFVNDQLDGRAPTAGCTHKSLCRLLILSQGADVELSHNRQIDE
jgi:hypothetical protein